VVTKGALVRRDADLLARLEQRAGARVFLSIPFADEATARALEPWAPAPAVRYETLRRLTEAGVPTGVAVSPVVPGLSESHVAEILERAREAGASHAFLILLRLPGEVLPVFTERLRAALPLRAAKVLAAVAEMRADQSCSSAFGQRMRGAGPRWEAVRGLFELSCRRLGLATGAGEPIAALAPGPTVPRATQRTLFDPPGD
jgi:DNA repair photolyase